MLDSIDFSSKADEHLTVKITPIKNTCPLLCEHNDFSICKGVFQPTDFGLNDVPIIQQMQKATEECKLYDQALHYHDWSINDDSSFKITQSTNRHLNGQPNHLSFCSIAQYNYAKKKNKKNKSKPSNVEVRNERKTQKEITQTRQKERQVKLQNSLDANNVRDILLTSLFPSSAKRAMVLFKLEQTAPEHLQPRVSELMVELQADDFGSALLDCLRTAVDAVKTTSQKVTDTVMTIWTKILEYLRRMTDSLRTTVANIIPPTLRYLLSGEFLKVVGLGIIYVALLYFGYPIMANTILATYCILCDSYAVRAVGLVLSAGCLTSKVLPWASTKTINVNVTTTNGATPPGIAIPVDLQNDIANDTTSSIIAIVTLICTCLFSAAAPSVLPSSYASFAKSMNNHAQVIKGFNSISETFDLIFSKGVKAYAFHVHGIDPDQNDIPDDIKQIIEASKEFVSADYRRDLGEHPRKIAKIFDTYDKYNNLRVTYRTNRVLTQILDKLQGPMVNIYALANSFNRAPGTSRVEPVVVMFRGGSGVGKSSLLYHVATEILAHDGNIQPDMTDEEIYEKINTCIYPRASENEYWDGYQKNTVTMVDDAFQVRDSTANPNIDYMELIRMSNPFPYPLHMAELSAKSNTHFTSRCVLYTTNVNKMAPESLISTEAVVRRITMPFEVRIDPAKATKTGALKDEYKTGDIDVNVYQFHRWDPTSGCVSERHISYQELMSILKSKLTVHRNKFDRSRGNLIQHARAIMVEPQAWVNFRWPQTEDRSGMNPHFLEYVEEVLNTPEEDWSMPAMTLQLMSLRDSANLENPESVTRERLMARYDEFREAYHLSQLRDASLWEALRDCVNSAYNFVCENATHIATALNIFVMIVSLLGFGLAIWKIGSEIGKTNEELNHFRDVPVDMSYPDIEVIIAIKSMRNEWMSWYDYDIMDRYCNWLQDRSVPIPEEIFVQTESGKQRENIKRVRFERSQKLAPLSPTTPSTTSIPIDQESGKARTTTVKKVAVEDDDVQLQAWNSENAEQLSKVVKNNQVRIKIICQDKVACNNAMGFFISGRSMLLNQHYVTIIKELEQYGAVKLQMFSSNTNTEYNEYAWSELKHHMTKHQRSGEPTDIVIINVPRMDRKPCLLKHLLRKENLSSIEGKHVALSIVNDEQWQIKFGQVKKMELCSYTDDNVRTVVSGLETSIGSSKGDCGSVYILDDRTSSHRLCGFHFAGTLGSSFAIPLVFEDFAHLGMTVYEMPKQTTSVTLNGNVSVLGEVKPAVFMSTKSKIMKTKMFGQLMETKMAPAVLDYRLDGPVLGKAMEKQFKKQPMLDKWILASSVNDYHTMLGKLELTEQRVLTFDEAVKGIDGDEYIRGIERTTSAGYPYAQNTTQKGKQEWFGKDEWTLNSKKALEIKRDIEGKIQEMEKGNFVEFIFMDTLKDETREISKVKDNKTRLFSAAPLDFLIIFRMYFMTFLGFMMKNRIKSESAVGIRAFSMEWDQLAKKLLSKGNKIIAGDFSNYDGTLHNEILWEIFDIINDFYPPNEKEQNVRRMLWESICSSTHICGSLVYRVNHSQPSGNPATAILNSMYNSIACRYTYYASGHENFGRDVAMIAYGDDNVLSVNPSIGTTFNQGVMSQEFEKIGMIYTDENKNSVSDFRTLSEVSFLKRGFKRDHDLGFWTAPLNPPSIIECFNWIHKTSNEREIIEQNIEMAGLELSLHPKQYDNITNKIKLVVKKKL